MKKGIELRKIVTIVEFYDLEDLVSEEEVTNFIEAYSPSQNCYVHFKYTDPKDKSYFPELERILKEDFEVSGSEYILVHFDY